MCVYILLPNASHSPTNNRQLHIIYKTYQTEEGELAIAIGQVVAPVRASTQRQDDTRQVLAITDYLQAEESLVRGGWRGR